MYQADRATGLRLDIRSGSCFSTPNRVEKHSLAIQFGKLSKKNSSIPNCWRVRMRS